MLVDQDDTPLYLGAIHRVLRRPDLAACAAARAGSRAGRGPQDAIAALAPATVVATDGQDW